MHRWPCDAAGLIVPGSFVLIPKSTCTTWESVDPNAKETVGLGFFVHLAGGIRVPGWCELCHRFSWVWIFNPKWIQHTQAGHLGELWCKLHDLLPWPWIYLGVPDPWVRPACSVNALFPSGGWSLVGWKQLYVSKPLRSPTAHGSRADKRDLVHLLAPSSQKVTNFSKTPGLCLS